MWPFKSKPKTKTLASVNWEGPWREAEGQQGGRPLVARIHMGVEPLIGDGRYPHLVGVALKLRRPDDQGMPTPEEAPTIERVERRFREVLERGHRSVQVLALTTAGRHELVFYTRDPGWAGETAAALGAEVGPMPVEVQVDRDPRWELFNRFYS